MKKVLLLLAAICLFTTASALENLTVGSTTRTMIVYAPKNLPEQPALVIALHGANQDAPYLQSYAKFESLADTAKFVVVYANGVNKFWDISGNSDLQFMQAIIDAMHTRYNVNLNRVYLTGFSMGGMFTYYAASKMANKIAAFAPVSGYPQSSPNATSTRPVPILHTHGTTDDVCVYENVQQHIDAWVRFNGCNTTPEIIKPYPKSKPNSPASLKRYRGGRNGVEVALLTLPDKGHWWSMDTNYALTSVEVWNFCKRYSLDGSENEDPIEYEVPTVAVNEQQPLLKLSDDFTEGGCVPDGWTTYDSDELRTGYSNGYGLGCRILQLTGSPRDFDYGLYFRNKSGAHHAGYAKYGAQGSTKKLQLAPGHYELRYKICSWNRTDLAPVTICVEKAEDGTEVASESYKPTVNIGNTASNSFSGVEEQTFSFDIATEDNYALAFYTQDAGWADAMIGALTLALKTEGMPKNYLTFKTEDYCAANWDAGTNTFTWGLGGNDPAWTFMAAEGVSGDLSGWKKLHLHVSDFKNASAKQLRVVFKKNDGSWPPNGPTKEFVVSPDDAGNIDISLEGVDWGNCDITNIQDLTIYGCARDNAAQNGSVKITEAYYIEEEETTGIQPVNKSVNITVDGETRSYWLYIPKGCEAGAPLVVAMHGASGHSTDNSPAFNSIADAEKFIVAYPQGKDIYFPVFGGTVTGWDASGEVNGDTRFLRAVVDELAEKYEIDRQRVYCCGFSNGGMNTYALTNTCSDVFAAFASISGFPLNEFHLRHTGERPVPFLHIHGKNDDFVKYSLMPTIVDEMVARMGANPVPVKTTVSGKYTKSVYKAMDGSFPYVYYEIDGMGHNDFTTNTEDGSSSKTMWNFFKQYTLDTPCDKTLKWCPRLETKGFAPKSHGWTMNSGTTLLSFGLGQKTDGNQNVYHSLQLAAGRYKLRFKSAGDAGKTVSVKLQSYDSNAVILDKTVSVGKDATLYFTADEAWAQYKITFSRANTTDAITVSDLSIYTATEEEGIEPGDVNGDGKVDIVDVTSTISHILGQTPEGFDEKAADVNNDGKVDIVDVTTIIDIILGK